MGIRKYPQANKTGQISDLLTTQEREEAMPIVDTFNEQRFINDMLEVTGDFSREALSLIYDYLEQRSDNNGEPVEFDPVDHCQEFREAFPQQIAKDHSIAMEYQNFDRHLVRSYLEEKTTVLGETNAGRLVFIGDF
jgi:hypothetical protein